VDTTPTGRLNGKDLLLTTSQLIDSVASTTSHRDRDDLDLSMVRLLLEFIDAESVAMYHVLDDNGVKRVMRRAAQRRGLEAVGPEEIRELAIPMALSDIPAWRDCVLQHKVVQYLGATGHSHNVFPIKSEREVVGVLEVEVRGDLQSRDAQLIDALLRIMKNHLALLDYGECDTLTGLLNRKTFEASFDKLRLRLQNVGAAATNGEPSWLGIVDIDKFKSINDNYGHLFGDEVLLLMAGLMKQSFRGADQLFRFGGEEFVIVLDHASTAGAEIAFDRLRAKIEAHTFPQVGRVTISLGYTQIDPQDAATTCVERADAALYYAKHHGRNLVRHYEALIAAGELTAKKETQADVELF
jgi:diguanylate cyclase (GGDEF)-like protein